MVEERTEPRQPTTRLERRDEYRLGEARRSRLDCGHLQFLARSEMSEQPALGQARTLGQRANRQRLKAAFACLRQRGVEDRSPRMLAFVHKPNIRTFVLFCKGFYIGKRKVIKSCRPNSANRQPQPGGAKGARNCATTFGAVLRP